MFQVSGTVGIAKANNLAPCLFSDPADLRRWFAGPFPPKCPGGRFSKFFADVDWEVAMLALPVVQNVELTGYMESHEFINSAASKSMFRFSPGVLRKAADYVGALGRVIKVGVHIRRGDRACGSACRYRQPSEEYLRGALAYFRAAHPSVCFVVASDDVQWVRAQRLFQAPDVHVVTEKHAPAEDMAVLAACNHMVLSVGTFGFWSAWIGAGARGGVVVYYEDEFRKDARGNRSVRRKAYFPETWIGYSGDGPLVLPTR